MYQVSNNWIATTHHVTKINTSICLSSLKIFAVILKTMDVHVLQDNGFAFHVVGTLISKRFIQIPLTCFITSFLLGNTVSMN